MKNIRIYLTSLNFEILNLYLKFLNLRFAKLKIINNTFFIKKKKKRITLLKSPHVNKKAREQFEISFNKVIIKLKHDFNLIKNIIINKPKAINIKIKFIGR